MILTEIFEVVVVPLFFTLERNICYTDSNIECHVCDVCKLEVCILPSKPEETIYFFLNFSKVAKIGTSCFSLFMAMWFLIR